MIVAREDGLTARAVLEFCRARLAAYKDPRRVEIVPELPRNSMGKVQKFRIIEHLAAK